jgi:hypothetical protein
MAKKTKNTKNEPNVEWLLGMNPMAIENQESEGQHELVESQQLPRKCNSPRGINAAEQYHKMGIKVFTKSKGDDLFIGVKLPDGWKKEGTDHSMWNRLVDDKGRVRGQFFYKAAFYDRDSFMNFTTRYTWRSDYSEKNFCGYDVFDSEKNEVIFKTEKMSTDCNTPGYFKTQDKLQQQCKDFLNNNFPNHEDINAYWS